jgi:hypothetical protein
MVLQITGDCPVLRRPELGSAQPTEFALAGFGAASYTGFARGTRRGGEKR